MKNYYKILQIDKDASPEIIKVAYKLLVKKYHPDLKEGTEKKQAEEKIKEINEAYDVLSDSLKREEYNQSLINESISQEQYFTILEENESLKRELNIYRRRFNYVSSNNTQNYSYSNSNTHQTSNETQLKSNVKNILNLISKSLKNIIALFITLLIVFILINIPFIRSLIPSLFDSRILFILIVVLTFIYYFKNK